MLGLPTPRGSLGTVKSIRESAEGLAKFTRSVAVGTGPFGVALAVTNKGPANPAMLTSGTALGLAAVAKSVAQVLKGIENGLVDAQANGRIADVLKNVIASAPSERQQAVLDHLKSKWPSLRSHFHALSGTDAPARDRAAAALARNRALNALVGIDPARLPDAADVLGLVDDMKDILNDEHDESPLTNQQYIDVAARLAGLKQANRPEALWHLRALQTPATLADDASPEFRLAATLLKDAGCDYDLMKDALVRAEAQSGAAVPTEARTAPPTDSEAADIGQQMLPPYIGQQMPPRYSSEIGEPSPSYPPPTTAR